MSSPILLVPAISCIPLSVIKLTDASNSLRPKEHLKELGQLCLGAFGLYLALHWTIFGIISSIPEFQSFFSDILLIRTMIWASYCILLSFAGYKLRQRAGGKDLPTLEHLKGEEKKSRRIAARAADSFDKASERIDKLEEKVAKLDELAQIAEKIKRSKRDYERLRGRLQEFIQSSNDEKKIRKKYTKKFESFEAALNRLETTQKNFKDSLDKTAERLNQLTDTVGTLRGQTSVEKGEKYEDELVKTIDKLGLEVETGGKRGPDIVIKKPDTENPILVIGAKDRSLRSKGGMSDQFNPELEKAREENVPMVAAIKNDLNDVEYFRIYEPEDLEDFTCSAPKWLSTKGNPEKQEERSKRSKAKFRNLLFRETTQ